MPMPARLITALGETLTVAEWAKRTGIHAKTITTRIDRLGHTPEQALSKKTDHRLGRRKKPANMPKPCPVAKEVPPVGASPLEELSHPGQQESAPCRGPRRVLTLQSPWVLLGAVGSHPVLNVRLSPIVQGTAPWRKPWLQLMP